MVKHIARLKPSKASRTTLKVEFDYFPGGQENNAQKHNALGVQVLTLQIMAVKTET